MSATAAREDQCMEELVSKARAVERPVGHHGEDHPDLPAGEGDAAVHAAPYEHGIGHAPTVLASSGYWVDRHWDAEPEAKSGRADDVVLQITKLLPCRIEELWVVRTVDSWRRRPKDFGRAASGDEKDEGR